jgi:hypothetical protein
MDFIRQHYKFMIEKLDAKHSGLIGDIAIPIKYSLEREKEELNSCEISTCRTEILLSMLSRKSPKDFEAFLEALSQTGQGHIPNKIRGNKLKLSYRLLKYDVFSNNI